MITGYADGRGRYRFTALFVAAGDATWEARHDLTPDGYQTLYDPLSPKGFRPVSATAYPTPDGPRFAAAFLKDGSGWVARHDLTPDGYQAEFDQRVKEGYQPLVVTGYPAGTPDVAAFDTAMKRYMSERSIPAGTLAVSWNGKLLLSRGYGFADADKTRAVRAEDPFRLASVVKPITAAAIRKLVAEGKLRMDTKAFRLLGLKPFAGQTPDARLNNVTVQHLLEHRGGWDRDTAFDPMFRPLEIARAAGKAGPAGPEDVIRYMIGQPLQFDPGAKEKYSNFGYCVLGRVIEKVTGKPYVRYVREDVLAPLGISSVQLGRSLPADRNAQEPVYVDPGKGKDVVRPQSPDPVPDPDGTFYLEAMDAHGGLIGSAPDLIRFLEAYWINGEPRRDPGQDWAFFGSLPGTWTMVLQRPNGVNVVTLFNQRTDSSGRDYNEIQMLMRTAADGLTGGGLRYVVVFVKR
jgi:N-acyl-D-amino-acid deacylase